MSEKIRKSTEKIRNECDIIEEEIEPKSGKTLGDPVVILDKY